jgi:hypothetical protein
MSQCLAAIAITLLTSSAFAQSTGPADEVVASFAKRLFIHRGERIPCNSYFTNRNPGEDPWPKAQVHEICPKDSVLVSGGCDLTCLNGLQHTVSVPWESTKEGRPIIGWTCGAISNDAERKFGADLLCLKLKE